MAEPALSTNLGGVPATCRGTTTASTPTTRQLVWYNGWVLDNGFGINEYPRDQANAALTWFAGENHEIKFGVDWQQVERRQDVRTSGSTAAELQRHQPDRILDTCGSSRASFCFVDRLQPCRPDRPGQRTPRASTRT